MPAAAYAPQQFLIFTLQVASAAPEPVRGWGRHSPARLWEMNLPSAPGARWPRCKRYGSATRLPGPCKVQYSQHLEN